MRALSFIMLALAGGACAPVYVSTGPVADRGLRTVDERRVESERTEPARTEPAHEVSSPAVGSSSALAQVLATLVWPLAVDRTSILTSHYGMRAHPADGAQRFHAGLDMRAREGTPVHAAADGIVTHSGTSGAYGNRVIIEHAAGLASLYGHHSENLVREGDSVRRGDVIALVGHTGNATGDHLHFELRWDSGTVDPIVVLPPLRNATVAR